VSVSKAFIDNYSMSLILTLTYSIKFGMTTRRDATTGFVRKEYQLALDIDTVRLYYPWDHNGVPLKICLRDEDMPQSLGTDNDFVLLVEDEVRFLNSYKGEGGWKKRVLKSGAEDS
jgi:hypothetical protein